MKYKKILKILNPLIFIINLFTYCSHLDLYKNSEYKPYDFNKDIKYF